VFSVQGLGFSVQGSGLRIQDFKGLGFWFKSSGYRVSDIGLGETSAPACLAALAALADAATPDTSADGGRPATMKYSNREVMASCDFGFRGLGIGRFDGQGFRGSGVQGIGLGGQGLRFTIART
jgi:hypothetical protein